MKKILFTTFVLSAISIPAGAYEADRVSMNYEPESVETVPAPIPGACSIVVVRGADIRPNKESIGHEYKPILSGDPVPWVDTAFDDLKRYGFTVKHSDTFKPETGAIVVRPELFRSYVWHGQLRINGMVAMNVDYITPSGKSMKMKYRASGSKSNWAGGTAEYMTALNYAINNTMAKLANDMVKLCGT
jgi:uncharacterized lipoprotein YajG